MNFHELIGRLAAKHRPGCGCGRAAEQIDN